MISKSRAVVPQSLPKRGMAFGQDIAPTSPFGNLRFGNGGRSSNSGMTATVFGAYGFVGRYFVNELGQCGSRVYVPFRGCEMEPRHLKPMFDLGQLGLMAFSPRDEESIKESIRNSDIVINMIGKHYETKHLVPTRREDGELSRINYSFQETHVEIPRTLARLCKEAGVESFVHVSALAGDPNSESAWSRSKYEGELAVREENPDAIIVRPATVFGWEDRFLNTFADITERLPFTPLLFGGETLTQPVYALDVGKALFAITQRHKDFKGATFQLAGPAEYSYKEIAEFVQDVTTVKKPLVDIPEFAATAAGNLLNETIEPLLTPDQVIQMKEDCVLKNDKSLKTLHDLGIEPSSMDKYAFDFLHRFRPGGHFSQVEGYH